MTKIVKRLIVGSTILFSTLFFAGAAYALPDTPSLPSEGSGPDLPPDPGGPSLPPFPELPPCPECDEFDGEPTPTSTSIPTPTSTPSEEPTPEVGLQDGDVCANIDGIQTSVPGDLHLDASGKNCVAYQFGGPPQSSGGTGGTSGQVLGLSATSGSGLTEAIVSAIGILCLTLGVALKKAPKAFINS